VSGFPHNVAFYENKIPQGSADMLAGLIPAAGKIGPLSSRLMLQPNETVEIAFVGVPAGEYGYYCTPHEALGMVATLTIAP
jgi:plastocyanin